MRLLLDTHIFIWASSSPANLPPRLGPELADPSNELFVSAATAWEIAIKHAQGRLRFPVADFHAMAATLGAHLMPMSADHGLAAGALPPIHGDPFDRMLVAQARAEGLILATVDKIIPQYGVPVLPTKN